MRVIYSGVTLVVWAGYTNDGLLAFDGQDLGGHPAFDEYEYFIRISPNAFPAMSAALGGSASDDVLSLVLERGSEIVVSGETTWLKAHGIPYTFSNWGH